MFNSMCQRHILHSVSGFNDYNESIIELLTIVIFVDLAARVFPRLWKHLYSQQNIEDSRHRSDDKNIARKKTSRSASAPYLEEDELFLQSQVVGSHSGHWIQWMGGGGRTLLNDIKTVGVCISASSCD